ncbi:MAG: Fe-only nitrogenase accessory AnfO family protein [Methanoregula sp.]|jgi:Fe-only nitrogenase accessory protein AnfO
MCISEIAVITGNDGTTIPLSEPGTVVVFRRIQGTWQNQRMLPFSLEQESSLSGLRHKMAELIGFLGDCRTVVAQSASGAVFFELEKARCSVWEIAGLPEEFLDSVWRDAKEEADAAAPPAEGATIPTPRETAPGRFTISIKEIQGKRPEVSSKQVLQQFIRRGAFCELEIFCDHLPPWIEVESERLGITIDTEYSAPNIVRVLLKKNPDGGCCS